jgi:hypothetical protein
MSRILVDWFALASPGAFRADPHYLDSATAT